MSFDLRFTKGQGTGNDFVLFSDPEGDTELTPTQIAAVCDRRFGVGADGLIRAVRSRNLDDGGAALGSSRATCSTKGSPSCPPAVRSRSALARACAR